MIKSSATPAVRYTSRRKNIFVSSAVIIVV